MRGEPKVYATRGEKVRDFLIGFVGWFLLNVLFGLLASLPITLTSGAPVSEPLDSILGGLSVALYCLPWIVNLGLIVLFLVRRRWIAFGMLGAFGAVLLCVIIAGVAVAVVCFSSNLQGP